MIGKHLFPAVLPLGSDYGEIAVLAFLMYREDRPPFHANSNRSCKAILRVRT